MSVEPERRGGLEDIEDKIHKTFDGRAQPPIQEKQALKIEDDSEESNLIKEAPQDVPIPPEINNLIAGLPGKQRPRN